MRKDASSLAGSERIHELKFERRSRNRGCIAAFAPAPAVSARFQHNQHPMIPATQIWNFSTLLSAFFKLWLLPLAQVSAFGEPLTCWKATETTTPALMLMCGKVTHKNLIDNRPLFRYYSSIWIEKTSLIQYNKVLGRYLYEGKNTNH